MKRVVIWGVGQGGKMMLNLLPADMRVVAFFDNNKKLKGNKIYGIPIIDSERLLKVNPDCIYIAILNTEACIQVKEQIEKLEITCKIISISEFREQFDIRLASLRLIAKEIKNRNITGAVAELGVYQGEFAAEINRIFPNRYIYLFDTFEGFDERDIEIENKYIFTYIDKFNNKSLNKVYSL